MRVMRTAHSHPVSCWLAKSGRGLALTILWCVVIAGSAALADDARSGGPAIPPGEERLIATMLGKGTRLSGCKLVRSGVEYTVINASYKCRPGGRVKLELCHPQNVTAPAFVQTQQFAITLQDGSPPLGFQDALVARIRSKEADFVWTWAEQAAVDGDADDKPSATD